MGLPHITSVSGVLALLAEPQDDIKVFALQKLNGLVDQFWAEISTAISPIEILYENAKFSGRNLAALVASKVYYHLEQYAEAMSFALGAGPLFDVSQHSEYVDTLVSKCIDEYVRQRVAQAETKEPQPIDERLERIVLSMFDRCFHDKQYKQALGIAVESRRLDKFEQAITGSDNVPEMLTYALQVSTQIVLIRDYRQTLLRTLVKLYRQLSSPDYFSLTQILTFLEDSKAIADLLSSFVSSGNEAQVLLADQLSFDLVSYAPQSFLLRIKEGLPATQAAEKPTETSAASSDKMEVSSTDPYQVRLGRLHTILSGETTIALTLDFLSRNNKSDLLLLKNIKTAVENRSSILHTATVFTNAVMHAGTTSDVFLRDNLE